MARDVTIRQACLAPPCATLLAAVRQFNEGAYFICHETLEELWNDRNDPLRDFYKGVLQISVGLLHLQRGNLKGARLLLNRGSELIRPMAPGCRGIDIADLQNQVGALLLRLDRQQTEGAPSLPEERPRIKLTPDA